MLILNLYRIFDIMQFKNIKMHCIDPRGKLWYIKQQGHSAQMNMQIVPDRH